MLRYLVNINDWSYYKLEITGDKLLSVAKGISNLPKSQQKFLKEWSRKEFRNNTLIEVEDINKLPISMITPSYCIFSNENIRRQFIDKLRKDSKNERLD